MSRKVLIVDDSSTMRAEISAALSPLGLTIVEAEHGDDGLKKLEEHPDTGLVISDVNMPWKDGFEMLEEIRSDDKHKSLPVIMLTTEANPDEIERAKRLGIKAWLIKPFRADALKQVVSKLVA